MSVSIRPAAPNDYLAVESIENAADQLLIDRLNPESWVPAPSGLSRAAEHGFVLVAERTGTDNIIGFVQVLESDGIAHLEQLSVLPQEGRRGYGRRLLEAAIDQARSRGYETVDVADLCRRALERALLCPRIATVTEPIRCPERPADGVVIHQPVLHAPPP